MNEIRFLCGCAFPLKQKEIVVSEDLIETRRVIDGFVQLDAEGMLTCREHGQRRYGWRSLPPVVLTDEHGQKLVTNRADYRNASKSPAEIEKTWLDMEGILVG